MKTDSERETYTYKDYLHMCKTHWGHYQEHMVTGDISNIVKRYLI